MKADGTPEHTDFPKLSVLRGAYYEHEGRDRYAVGLIAEAILAAPNQFQFGLITFRQINCQLDGQGNIDEAYAATLKGENLERPLIMITEADGSIRIVDGYHRAFQARRLGAPGMPVWILDRHKTLQYMMR